MRNALDQTILKMRPLQTRSPFSKIDEHHRFLEDRPPIENESNPNQYSQQVGPRKAEMF